MINGLSYIFKSFIFAFTNFKLCSLFCLLWCLFVCLIISRVEVVCKKVIYLYNGIAMDLLKGYYALYMGTKSMWNRPSVVWIYSFTCLPGESAMHAGCYRFTMTFDLHGQYNMLLWKTLTACKILLSSGFELFELMFFLNWVHLRLSHSQWNFFRTVQLYYIVWYIRGL